MKTGIKRGRGREERREEERGRERERDQERASFAVLHPTMKSGTSFNGIYSNSQQFLCALLYEIMINLIAGHAIALKVDVPLNCEKCLAVGWYCQPSLPPPCRQVELSFLLKKTQISHFPLTWLSISIFCNFFAQLLLQFTRSRSRRESNWNPCQRGVFWYSKNKYIFSFFFVTLVVLAGETLQRF